MNHFQYQKDELYAENVPVTQIVKQYGTPCYIYSRTEIEQQWRAFDETFAKQPHRICYSVKANSNLAILHVLARLGSGFDIVSGGELARVLVAGGKPESIVFSGVGKQTEEIKQALTAGVRCFNIESKNELDRLNQLAKQMGVRATIALRINPDIDASTHPHIMTGLKENKFGIPIEDALELYVYAASLSHLEITGIACHLGSQITTLDPFLTAMDRLIELVDALKQQKITISHLDIGGGLGISYHLEKPPSPSEYAAAVLAKLAGRSLELILEPGRAIVADAGILVTRIEYLKHHLSKNFAIVDAAMNDLIRPALYDAWHGILPVVPRRDGQMQLYDVVGPVCETSDFLGKTRHLSLQENDLLAICTVGAYGFVMSSNYNSRPRAAEILVDKDKFYLAKKREEITQLFADELPCLKEFK